MNNGITYRGFLLLVLINIVTTKQVDILDNQNVRNKRDTSNVGGATYDPLDGSTIEPELIDFKTNKPRDQSTDSSGEVDEAEDAQYIDAELRLKDALLKNYTKMRPVRDHRKAVEVHVEFFLMKIIDIDSLQEVMSTRGKFVFLWLDERLKWSPADYGQLDEITLPAESVWLPDVGITNSVEKVTNKDWWENGYVSVISPGYVIWAPEDRFDTGCELTMTYFPYDYQLCRMYVGTITSTNELVTLNAATDHINMNYVQQNSEWYVVRNSSFQMEKPVQSSFSVVSSRQVQTSRVVYEILLRRRSSYYFINIVLPCILLSFISALVFRVPADAGAKITLSITVLLTFCVFLMVIGDAIPRISTSIPVFAVYLTFLMFLNVIALACTIYVLNNHYKQPMRPVPYLVRLIVLDCFGALFGNSGVRGKYVVANAPSSDKGEREKEIFKKITRNNKHDTVISLDGRSNASRDKNSTPSKDRRSKSKSPLRDKHGRTDSPARGRDNPQLSQLNDVLNDVLSEVRRARRDISMAEINVELADQWKAVAQILDSMFFTVYILVLIISSIMLLFVGPIMGRAVPDLYDTDAVYKALY